MKEPTYPIISTLWIVLSAFAWAPVVAQPVIDGIEPSQGRVESGTRITVHGSGFEPTSTAALIPGGPYVVGASYSSVEPISIVVAGGLAYVTGRAGGCSERGGCSFSEICEIFDVSDPRNLPIGPIGTTPATDCGAPAAPARVDRGIRFEVVRANVISGHQIVSIDPTDPDPAHWLGAVPLDVRPFDPYGPGALFSMPYNAGCVLSVQAGVAYAACGGMNGGYDGGSIEGVLIAIDVSDPFSPGMPRPVPVEQATALVSRGTTLFAGTRDGDLAILDITDPGAPVPLDRVAIGGPVGDLAIAGDRVYAAGLARFGPGPLRIVDVSDPHSPRIAGELGTLGNVTRVAATGDLALLVADEQFLIVDATDPTAPTVAGGLPVSLTGFVKDVGVTGTTAILSACHPSWGHCRSQALHVVDISDPAQPTIVSSTTTSSLDERYGHRLGVSGHRVYALRSGQGNVLDAFDIGDLTAIVHLGAADVGETSSPWDTDLTVVGDRAYASLPGHGVSVLRIDEAGMPTVVGSLRGVGVLYPEAAIDIAGGHSYVGDDGPTRVVRLTPGLEDVRVASDVAVEAIVPAGLEPGPYDALITNFDGSRTVRPNAFRICDQRAFAVSLAPIGLAVPAPKETAVPIAGPHASLRWRLTLGGDAALFDPPSHEATLAIPLLPTTLTTRFVSGDGSGRMSIELQLAPDRGFGEVVLTGDDRAAIETLWADIKSKVAIALPRLDEWHYGDLVLAVHPTTNSRQSARYRYEFALGKLETARAWGRDVDLVIEARAADEFRCTFRGSVSLVETLRAVCAGLHPAAPSLALACSR